MKTDSTMNSFQYKIMLEIIKKKMKKKEVKPIEKTEGGAIGKKNGKYI